jgi:hypothetical protein
LQQITHGCGQHFRIRKHPDVIGNRNHRKRCPARQGIE